MLNLVQHLIVLDKTGPFDSAQGPILWEPETGSGWRSCRKGNEDHSFWEMENREAARFAVKNKLRQFE